MTATEKLSIRFDQIRTKRPDTSGFIHNAFGWICRIAGWLLFIAGAGLLLATGMSHSLFDLTDYDNKISSIREAYEQIVLLAQGILGTGGLALGIVLLMMAALCRSIVKRNTYILDLEELIENN